jgi:hypothetical protein
MIMVEGGRGSKDVMEGIVGEAGALLLLLSWE